MKKVVFILLGLGFGAFLLAHSGGTNSAGCHTDHKTGIYHCH
ncbi:YHYH domain-containing protein [Aliarcobacter butzleri]|nr:YHYH domain-containing protein [Aliarcobacter butzleri]